MSTIWDKIDHALDIIIAGVSLVAGIVAFLTFSAIIVLVVLMFVLVVKSCLVQFMVTP